MRILRVVLPAALFLFGVGCPGGPGRIDATAAYPTLGETRPVADGRTALIVFTSTFMDLNLATDDGTMFRPTGYTIYTDQGEYQEYVRNYLGARDTQPTTVELEPGKYLILLDAPGKQPPVFRVVLERGRLSTVTLPR